MPYLKNFQKGLVQPIIIIGAILILGAIFLITNLNKINLVNVPISSTQKSTGSWLYKVDLTKCQKIVDRANLNNELQVVKDPQATWQHSCSLAPKQSSIDSFGLGEVVIDAIYDEQGVIDPIGNAIKFKSKDPILNFVAEKYIGKNYKDIYQEPEAINDNFEAYKYSLEKGYAKIDKQGTFPTTEGNGAYIIIRNENVTVDYIGYSHAKKGSCNIIMRTDSTESAKKGKLEEQLVQMVQKIDQAINTECGKVQNG